MGFAVRHGQETTGSDSISRKLKPSFSFPNGTTLNYPSGLEKHIRQVSIYDTWYKVITLTNPAERKLPELSEEGLEIILFQKMSRKASCYIAILTNYIKSKVTALETLDELPLTRVQIDWLREQDTRQQLGQRDPNYSRIQDRNCLPTNALSGAANALHQLALCIKDNDVALQISTMAIRILDQVEGKSEIEEPKVEKWITGDAMMLVKNAIEMISDVTEAGDQERSLEMLQEKFARRHIGLVVEQLSRIPEIKQRYHEVSTKVIREYSKLAPIANDLIQILDSLILGVEAERCKELLNFAYTLASALQGLLDDSGPRGNIAALSREIGVAYVRALEKRDGRAKEPRVSYSNLEIREKIEIVMRLRRSIGESFELIKGSYKKASRKTRPY